MWRPLPFLYTHQFVERRHDFQRKRQDSERSRVKQNNNFPWQRSGSKDQNMFAKLISPCMKNSLSKVMCNNDDSRCYNNNISFILESELRFVRKGGGR